MRQSVADFRPSKFDWKWKYENRIFQGSTTITEVLARAKFKLVKKDK